MEDKKEAQYFFSESTIKFVTDSVLRLKFTNILCIGCPTLFENLPKDVQNSSILWDIDGRLSNFYHPDKFLWGNFFNGHFFLGESSSAVFQNFLINCDKLLIIVDPPFGAKTELINFAIDQVKDKLDMLNMKSTVRIMWVYPYFMERQVTSSNQSLIMSDYRVTYSDHVQYGDSGQARKQGSPVRIFTDLPLNKLQLPSPDYRHCAACDVWRHVTNVHCDTCGTCPSKDGRTYIHCDTCGRCVKPTYQHCHACNRCALPQHNCSQGPGSFDQKKRPIQPQVKQMGKRTKNHKQYKKSKKLKR